jgi:hypothetical protein
VPILDPAARHEAAACDLVLQVLESFGEARLTAQGASMIPALWPGDMLLVHRMDAGRVSPGDIVLCRRVGGLRAHRLLAKLQTASGTVLVTRGDALSEDDPPQPAAGMLGRVSAVVRGQAQRPLSRRLSFGQTMVALLARRSAWATRILVRAHSVPAAVRAGRGFCSQEALCPPSR